MSSSRTAQRIQARGALALALWMAAACATVNPPTKPVTDVPSAGKFPHERLSGILEKAVSDDGLVDYAALSLEQELLDAYLAEVGRVSPDSHPHLFPTEDDRMAFWINAHNACALRAVLRFNRPSNLSEISGRFDHTEFFVGGKKMSIAAIVNHIRRDFPDPRVHLVLVRGRRGGPPLSKEPYRPATLQQQLDRAARAYLGDERNVQWTAPSTQVRLSHVVLEFRSDFERQVAATVTGDERLVAALNKWRDPRRQLLAVKVAAIPYDERLNDVTNR